MEVFMELEKQFEPILDKGETIKSVLKPNKLKFWVSNIVYVTLFILFYLLMFLVASFGMIEEQTMTTDIAVVTWSIFAGSSALVYIIDIIYSIFYYRNVFYAVTDQRVLIRRGVFGTDFKSLDMKMIGAVNVNVTLLDKICRTNTGTILFGSTSSPVGNTMRNTMYMFSNIKNPYDEYKKIKSYIDEKKTQNEQK